MVPTIETTTGRARGGGGTAAVETEGAAERGGVGAWAEGLHASRASMPAASDARGERLLMGH